MLAYIKLKDCVVDAEVLNNLERFSPTLEVLGTDGILVDLGVMVDRKAIRAEGRRLAAALSRQGAVGMAEGRFVAGVAARLAEPGKANIIFAGDEAVFLESKPVACLPVTPETVRRLDLLGVVTLGDVAKLPADDLANLFGKEGSLISALARGNDEVLVAGEKLVQKLASVVPFDFPIDGGEALFGEIVHSLEALCEKLRDRLQYATRVVVTLDVVGSSDITIDLNLASPTDNVQRIAKPLKDRFAALKLKGAIGSLEVSLEGFVDVYARQLTLESLLPKASRWRSIERLLQRLSVRTDNATLMQVVWTDERSRIPERRGHLQDLVHDTLRRGLYLPKPVNVATDAGGHPKLVRTPGGWQPVDSIVEAWEIDDEWWTERPIARSYYRVMLHNGAIMRLFRDQRRGAWYHQNR